MLIGLRLGPYTIGSLIGAGGMGEVYRARDERLGRDVAIKMLPAAVTDDVGRLARFEREARVLAALNHPNIAAIYGVEQSPGPEGGPPVQGIVLELVEGETLAQRLARTGQPVHVADALALARQIAEALDAAHQRGIVHRDLKPANVKVTRDGVVKVLDFGLAKSMSAEPSGVETSTRSATATDDGQVLGTIPYMSPEQARGQAVDKRTDIWAFGCVLFELLSGRRAFGGETAADTVAAILEREPEWRALPATLPVSGQRLLRRCLEKDPKRRLRDIGDVRADLDDVAAAAAEVTVARGRTHSRARFVAAIAALVLAGVAAWLWRPSARVTNETIWRPRPMATSSSQESRSRISPDGQWISFLSEARGATQIFVKRIDGGEVKAIAVPAGTPVSQLWSPDGGRLAYVLRQGGDTFLQIVPAFFGGVPTQSLALKPAPSNVRLRRWIDQTIYAQIQSGRGVSLLRVDLAHATTTDLTADWKLDGTVEAYDVSPDGRELVFAMLSQGQEDLWTAALDGTGKKRLTDDRFFERYPLWSGMGAAIVFQSNRGGQSDLWQFDLDSSRFVRLTSSDTAKEPESTSADGRLLSYGEESDDAHLWRWDAATTAAQQLTDDALDDFAPTVDAAGSSVVFQRSRPSSGPNLLIDSTLFLAALDSSDLRSEPQPLTDGFGPRLSPDGTELAYFQRGPDPRHATLLVKHLRTGDTVTVSRACEQPAYARLPIQWLDRNVSWSPSGRELFFVELSSVYTIRRYRLGAAEAGQPLATAQVSGRIHDLELAADGRTLAYLVSTAKASTLHLLDLQTGADRAVTSIEGVAGARGWLGADRVVVVRSDGFDDGDVDVLVVSTTGTTRRAGGADHALIATARLDAAASAVYLVRVVGGIHNLYELSIATGVLRQVTTNTLPGITISSVEPLGGQRFLAVRREQRQDVWVLDATPVPLDSRGPRSR